MSGFSFTVNPSRPEPLIVRIADVPNDQGGRVTVAWERSDFDRSNLRTITGYRVWRRAPLSSVEVAGASLPAKLMYDAATDWYWEAVATLPAALLSGYAYVASTTQDSIETGNPYTAFFVQALTADPFTFYSSEVDSGYSVDNLSPAQPAPFVAEYSLQSGVALHWGMSREVDLFGYRLYRGRSPAFVPSAANLIAAQPDTGFFDPDGDLGHSYKLAAVDIHGNVSRFALVTPDGPTSSLATLISARAEPDGVRLRWDCAANPGLFARIERRTATTDWAEVARRFADGTGRLDFEDRDVQAGMRYGYRLQILDAGVEVSAGETWIDVPRFSLALGSLRPHPFTGGDLELAFVLPGAEPALLEVLDVTGRSLSRQRLEGGPRSGSLRLPSLSLRPGVYSMRLTQGGRGVTTKLVVIR
jgi:hypothetical protein